MTNYCLPIIEKHKETILKIINDNDQEYHFFEIWIDYVEDYDEAFIMTLIESLGDRLIIVLRRKEFEETTIPLEGQKKIIDLVAPTESFLDLDYQHQQELLAYIKDTHIHLLLSYHNYHETPLNETLEKIVTEMKQYTPAIVKVATMCHSEKDALRLLALQQRLNEEKIKHIVLGMGEYGTITRVYGTLWGNEMIFAPIDTEASSAPGQLTKTQLEKIFANLSMNNEARIMNHGNP